VKQVVEAVDKTDPADHGLPGHNWTAKKLKQWVLQTFGLIAGRGAIRRVLRQAGLTWKKVKKLLGKAKPDKRAAHVQELLALFARACDGEVILIYVDEVHVHRDLDLGYTWGRRGQRLWRKSDCPKLQERMSAYGAYDFSNGECLLWQNGWCNGEQTVLLLQALLAWRAGKKGRLVLIWDNAPCHVAKVVTAEAARLGTEIVNLPGHSPDLNPIERLWDWMREEVTRGFCRASVPQLIEACQAFIDRINRDPIALVDRLWPKFELDPEFEAKLLIPT
jgi:transposase